MFKFNILLTLMCLSLGACGTPYTPDPTPKTPPPVSNPIQSQTVVVGAFNIQILGASKMSKPTVVAHLTKILSRFDLVLIQEIRDSSDVAIHQLLDEVNKVNQNRFDLVLGARAGRTTSKEQYAYFYDRHKFQVDDFYNYDDGVEPNNDQFEREPLVAKFRTRDTQVAFFLVGIHTKPEDTFNEIQHLKSVYTDASQRWGLSNGLLLGDMNADCSYLNDAKYSQLILVKDSTFTWQIPRTADTTSGTTNCAYDHLITTGRLTSAVVGAAAVYNYQNDLQLNDTETKAVSDHYPVQLTLSF